MAQGYLTTTNSLQYDNTLTIDISQFYTMKEEEVVTIDFCKEVNEKQSLENNINQEDSITKIENIFSLMNKYMEVSKSSNLKQIEVKLIKIHNDKFGQLLNKVDYDFKSLDDNMEKYKEIKKQIESLQKNIKFVSSNSLKDAIMGEINALSNIKSYIGSKLMELLNCDKESLEQAVKSQLLMDTK
ncbi:MULTISPECIES: hypothetical protein [Clostridium]|uniref:Uncharacterized protein n=1 Tax=Clostridium frigoriphilum TaxID=443253 RepID=A0ABU7UL57_9CLOT|nr:hypothetical protein [Clostridium sp. DSM 17811]MBU3097682.1 hypothetical protein [Clostridium sp. DSM 17811]